MSAHSQVLYLDPKQFCHDLPRYITRLIRSPKVKVPFHVNNYEAFMDLFIGDVAASKMFRRSTPKSAAAGFINPPKTGAITAERGCGQACASQEISGSGRRGQGADAGTWRTHQPLQTEHGQIRQEAG